MSSVQHICDLVIETARSRSGDEPAFIWPNRMMTWKDVEREVRVVAGGLRSSGAGEGHNIAVMLPNQPLHMLLSFASPMVGAVYFPLDPSTPTHEIARTLQRTTPQMLFAQEERRFDLLQALRDHDLSIPVIGVNEVGTVVTDNWSSDQFFDGEPIGDELAIATRRLSAGVTGEPRVIPLRHRHLIAAAEAARKALQVLHTDSMFGGFGFHTANAQTFEILLPALTGSSLRTDVVWDPDRAANRIQHEDVTAFVGSANVFEDLQQRIDEQIKRVRETETSSAASSVQVEDTVEGLQESATADDAENDPADSPAEANDQAENDQEPAASSDAERSPVASPASENEAIDSSQESMSVSDEINQPPPPPPAAPLASVQRHLRFAFCGGAHADLIVLNRFERALGCPVATAYGAVEAAGLIAVNPAHIDTSRRDSAGRPVSGMEIEIRDENHQYVLPNTIGEIWVRGHNLFDGYDDGLNSCFDDDGWFATADLGYIDDDRWLYLKSRVEDRMMRGGFSIYPQEVEAVLNSHPSVYESAMVGVPDPNNGETTIAFIVSMAGEEIHSASLHEHCAQSLPRYKIPDRYAAIDALPRSLTGFILRRELRERAKRL